MRRIEVISEVKAGKLVRNQTALREAIGHFEGKEILITVERNKTGRTNAQNRWYWGVAVQLVQLDLREKGYQFGKEETHEFIKLAVSKRDPSVIVEEIPIEATGEILSRIKSTSELSTVDFMAFKEIIQQWASETLDLNIPDPGEQLTLTDH